MSCATAGPGNTKGMWERELMRLAMMLAGGANMKDHRRAEEDIVARFEVHCAILCVFFWMEGRSGRVFHPEGGEVVGTSLRRAVQVQNCMRIA